MWQAFWSLTLASETSWVVVIEIMFSNSVLCVLVYCFSIILKQRRLVCCDNSIEKVVIDVACLDEIFTDFDSAPFLICNSAWNKICTDPPLSIIFINSITNYLPVNVQLIPSIFVFIQFCLATSSWVSTALLDYEQLTVTPWIIVNIIMTQFEFFKLFRVTCAR